MLTAMGRGQWGSLPSLGHDSLNMQSWVNGAKPLNSNAGKNDRTMAWLAGDNFSAVGNGSTLIWAPWGIKGKGALLSGRPPGASQIEP